MPRTRRSWRRCLSGYLSGAHADELDSTPRTNEKKNMQVSGLRATAWTSSLSLGSRLLQVRALPPEQAKRLMGVLWLSCHAVAHPSARPSTMRHTVSRSRRSATAPALRSGERYGRSVALVRAAMRHRDPALGR